MGEASDLAESMFAAYLDSHGYSHAFEPDLGVPQRPDFVIARDGIEVICEVKAFEGWGLFEPGGPRVGHRSMKDALSPVREAIRSASRQLKDVRDRGTPLMVVIANPHGRPLATGTAQVMWAMYGDPETQAHWRRKGQPPTGRRSSVATANCATTTPTSARSPR
jgi:hypothetical protein